MIFRNLKLMETFNCHGGISESEGKKVDWEYER